MNDKASKNWWQWPLAVVCIAALIGYVVGRAQGYAAGTRIATADLKAVVMEIGSAVATAPRFDNNAFNRAVAEEAFRQGKRVMVFGEIQQDHSQASAGFNAGRKTAEYWAAYDKGRRSLDAPTTESIVNREAERIGPVHDHSGAMMRLDGKVIIYSDGCRSWVDQPDEDSPYRSGAILAHEEADRQRELAREREAEK